MLNQKKKKRKPSSKIQRKEWWLPGAGGEGVGETGEE